MSRPACIYMYPHHLNFSTPEKQNILKDILNPTIRVCLCVLGGGGLPRILYEKMLYVSIIYKCLYMNFPYHFFIVCEKSGLRGRFVKKWKIIRKLVMVSCQKKWKGQTQSPLHCCEMPWKKLTPLQSLEDVVTAREEFICFLF